MNYKSLIMLALTASLSASVDEFIEFDRSPEPVGGYEALADYIIYPEIAWSAGTEGTVQLKVFVNAQGRVEQAEVLDGIDKSGLNEAAVAGIRRASFRPAIQRGLPIGVWLTITVTFRRHA
jgi:protein TonB